MSKVLHVSDNPLPDARVEKMAYLSKKKGCETFFAGPLCNSFALSENVFDRTYCVPRNPRARLGLPPNFQWVKRRLQRIIKSVMPDVIHAHNVFSAKMVCNSGYPFVFDDHEHVSLEKKSDTELGDLSDQTVGRYETWLWSRWEHELSSKVPIITVSDSIAEFYAKLRANVFTVPNYPSLFELSKAHFSEERSRFFTAVYLGNDVASSHKPYRDVKGIVNVFKELNFRFVVIGDKALSSEGSILSKGYINHSKLYDVISIFHVVLLPWKKHWFHKYANPNKPYIYAHSGLVTIVTSSMQNVIRAFNGRARTIENLSDLKEVLSELSQDVEGTIREGRNIKQFACDNLFFERYENKVMEAYEKAN
jgi:hypothetical protein